jgi:rod shape-determining protein MreD
MIGLAGLVLCFAWLLQLIVLSLIPVGTVLCSVPLMMTIVWGSVFGSPIHMPRAEELRHVSLGQVVAIQILSGSLSGALVGAFFGALYAALLPVFPFCYPLIGWIAGYFPLRSINQGILLIVPLVLLLTVLAESLMAGQLYILHRPDVFSHLAQVAIPEAIANALIAPFVFYPMRTWYEFTKAPAREGGQ